MSAFLSAREVCQRLREAALGVLAFNICDGPTAAGLIAVDIEGWQLLLDFEGGRLHHCECARNGDGQDGSLERWQRYGTDPVSLLSTWELAQIEQLLKAQTNEVAQ
jgi:hypothetical protein